MLLPLFGFALGSHLILDSFQGGNLVSIPAKYELPFYIANGFFVCIYSYFLMRMGLNFKCSHSAVKYYKYP